MIKQTQTSFLINLLCHRFHVMFFLCSCTVHCILKIQRNYKVIKKANYKKLVSGFVLLKCLAKWNECIGSNCLWKRSLSKSNFNIFSWFDLGFYPYFALHWIYIRSCKHLNAVVSFSAVSFLHEKLFSWKHCSLTAYINQYFYISSLQANIRRF